MSSMKILINSKQIFEEHEDKVFEEYHGDVVLIEGGFELKYDESKIIFRENKLIVTTQNTSMIIEVNRTHLSSLQTPYGVIELEINGEYMEWQENPFLFEVRYKVKMEQTQCYINELQIQIIED